MQGFQIACHSTVLRGFLDLLKRAMKYFGANTILQFLLGRLGKDRRFLQLVFQNFIEKLLKLFQDRPRLKLFEPAPVGQDGLVDQLFRGLDLTAAKL